MHMDHERYRALVSAELDGELGETDAGALAEHMALCPTCRAYAADVRALKATVGLARFKDAAPVELSLRIQADLSRAQMPLFSLPEWLRPLGVPLAASVAGTTLAAMCGAFIMVHSADMTRDLIRSHRTAVATQHLTEIAGAQSGRLRPWFTERLSYAPPVLDGSEVGCRLLGGRVENIRRKPTAALAYRCSGHLVSVYVEPSTRGRTAPHMQGKDGYQVVSWRGPKLACQAVSDLNKTDLLRLATYIQARADQI